MKWVKMAAATFNYMAVDDPNRTLRLIGAVAALLAVLGLAMLVFWFVIRFPRF